MKITQVTITAMPRPMPIGMFDPMPQVIATFEDPNCGYCKRLARDLQKLENITIYTFLLPILSEDSVKKSKQISVVFLIRSGWNMSVTIIDLRLCRISSK